MKTQIEFNINLISVIRIYDRSRDSYTWLPKKQKTRLFGLIKRNAWHDEGFYPYGCYREGYMGDEWDATPVTREYLISNGYQVDEDNSVWRKPHVIVQLGPKESISRKFETYEDAKIWAYELRSRNSNQFEIIEL
jgi:hypothetical protein